MSNKKTGETKYRTIYEIWVQKDWTHIPSNCLWEETE